MTLTVTLIALAITLSMTGYAAWRARRPYVPGKPSLIPNGALLFLGILASIILGAHLISLLTGQPFTGRLH